MNRHLKLICLTEDTASLSALEYPLTITASSDRYLSEYKIYGKSVQSGTPSVEAPAEVQSVGGLVTEGEHTGKYRIPVILTHGDSVKATDIYLDAPLRKINSYADYIDFKNKTVVRKVKEYIFDGSEVFGRITQYDGENTLYCYYNKFYDRHATGSYGVEKCNIFKGHNWHLQTSANTDFEAMVFNNAEIYNNWYYFRVNKTRLTGTTAAAVKAWVKSLYDAGTPMKVYYVLETAVEEPVDLPKLLQLKGNCEYTVETDITPSGLQVKYY